MTILRAVSPVLGTLIFNMTDKRPYLEKGLQSCEFPYFPRFRWQCLSHLSEWTVWARSLVNTKPYYKILKNKVFRICICYNDGWSKFKRENIFNRFNRFGSFDLFFSSQIGIINIQFFTFAWIFGWSKVPLMPFGSSFSVSSDEVTQLEGLREKVHSYFLHVDPFRHVMYTSTAVN